MKQPREAETALKRYVELVQKQPAAPADAADAEASDNGNEAVDDRRLTQAWLLLSQIAEQRGDLKPGATIKANYAETAGRKVITTIQVEPK